ncbi:MAG: hypothetical protein GC159_18850 [Phycisphaera sp.]|nr:hypothetical protein [Phycisphaera sp.]
MSATFKVKCPHCGKKHAIPQQFVGKVVLCQPCGQNFLVEAPPAPPPKPPKPIISIGSEVDDDLARILTPEVDRANSPGSTQNLDASDSELIDLDTWDKLGTIEEELD